MGYLLARALLIFVLFLISLGGSVLIAMAVVAFTGGPPSTSGLFSIYIIANAATMFARELYGDAL